MQAQGIRPQIIPMTKDAGLYGCDWVYCKFVMEGSLHRSTGCQQGRGCKGSEAITLAREMCLNNALIFICCFLFWQERM